MKKWLVLIFAGISAFTFAEDFAQKLEELKSGKITEARAEWFGFDAEDSTDALQKAFQSGAKTLIISRQSTPWIVSSSLNLAGNMEIIFESGAEITAKKGAFKEITDALLVVKNCKNLIIRGEGILSMNKSDYMNKSLYKPAEWRHTLALFSSENIKISDLTLRDSGGDGIYVHSIKDLAIDNITAEGHARQGISVITGENILIKNSRFLNTSGMAPMSGIDFEPNQQTEKLVNCVVENCEFVNNNGSGIEIVLMSLNSRSIPVSITVKNCKIIGNNNGIMIVNKESQAVKGSITFENCLVKESKLHTVLLQGQTADGYSVNIHDTVLDNTTCNSVTVQMNAGYIGSGALGNLHCSNVRIIEPLERPVFSHDDLKLHAIKNMTGGLITDQGKEVHFADILKKAETQKIIPQSKIDVNQLKISKIPAHYNASPLRLRFTGTFLQYAKSGQTITVQVDLFKLGAGHNGQVILKNPNGTMLQTVAVVPGQATNITFTASESGIYQFQFSTFGNGIEFRSAQPGNGYLVSNTIRGFRQSGKMSFVVPAGVKEIAIRVAGDNQDEYVSASLIDPDGKTVVTKEKITTAQLLYYSRPDWTKAECWTLDISAVEDYNLIFLGDIIPVLSAGPEMLE